MAPVPVVGQWTLATAATNKVPAKQGTWACLVRSGRHAALTSRCAELTRSDISPAHFSKASNVEKQTEKESNGPPARGLSALPASRAHDQPEAHGDHCDFQTDDQPGDPTDPAVSTLMTTRVVVVSPGTTLIEALQVMDPRGYVTCQSLNAAAAWACSPRPTSSAS